MKSPAFFSSIKKQYQTGRSQRHALIGESNTALSKSKRAIFAMHRDDMPSAQHLLKEAERHFEKAEKSFSKHPELKYQGAYRAALEEYAEAILFMQFLETGKFQKLDARAMDAEIFLGGLSDTTGEIVRYAVRRATIGKFDDVKKARDLTEMAVEYMLDLDLSGQSRQKFDQAKKNLRSLEQILYDASLKR